MCTVFNLKIDEYTELLDTKTFDDYDTNELLQLSDTIKQSCFEFLFNSHIKCPLIVEVFILLKLGKTVKEDSAINVIAVKSRIYFGGKESTLNTRIIDTADAVVRRYKTRNPEEIISQRAIKLKGIHFYHNLLVYYTILLNCEYIGINPNCTAAQLISALAHELGHALFDRKHASSGQTFQDTYFYGLDNSKTERRAYLRLRTAPVRR